jgi:hypothetical protein
MIGTGLRATKGGIRPSCRCRKQNPRQNDRDRSSRDERVCRWLLKRLSAQTWVRQVQSIRPVGDCVHFAHGQRESATASTTFAGTASRPLRPTTFAGTASRPLRPTTFAGTVSRPLRPTTPTGTVTWRTME